MMHVLSLGELFFIFSYRFKNFNHPVFSVFNVSPLIKKILVDEVGKISFKGLGSCDVNKK